MKQKILKIKVGDVYIDGKNHAVYQTAWRKESKKGGVYYELKSAIFPSEIEKREDMKVTHEDI
jgi:hypothetical protein